MPPLRTCECGPDSRVLSLAADTAQPAATVIEQASLCRPVQRLDKFSAWTSLVSGQAQCLGSAGPVWTTHQQLRGRGSLPAARTPTHPPPPLQRNLNHSGSLTFAHFTQRKIQPEGGGLRRGELLLCSLKHPPPLAFSAPDLAWPCLSTQGDLSWLPGSGVRHSYKPLH